MTYRFKLDEEFEAGVRRIGVSQIDRALVSLGAERPARAHARSAPRHNGAPREAAPAETPVSIHEARKSMKRIRALLRLVRPALGEAGFEHENAWFRDTSALLAHTRDTEILLETVVKLKARFADLSPEGLDKLHALIAAGHAGPDAATIAAARDEACRRLLKARTRLSRVRLAEHDFAAVEAGLQRSFRRAGRAFKRAYADPCDESFHEWRKGVQQHWRHMALLRRAWPDVADARQKLAQRLSQIIGDDHDLTILRQQLATSSGAQLSMRERRAIDRLARRRQDELRALAEPYGRRLHAENARGLSRRFGIYWRSAVALSAARAVDDTATDAARDLAPSD